MQARSENVGSAGLRVLLSLEGVEADEVNEATGHGGGPRLVGGGGVNSA